VQEHLIKIIIAKKWTLGLKAFCVHSNLVLSSSVIRKQFMRYVHVRVFGLQITDVFPRPPDAGEEGAPEAVNLLGKVLRIMMRAGFHVRT
jgi:hypothetical protein